MSDATATTLLDRSLGELVTELPARARVLERAGLDYCCHGRRTLAAAAAEAGLDAEVLAAELVAVSDPSGAEIDELDPEALVAHILATHHVYLHEELPALHALADKVHGAHGSRHPELAEVARLVAELEADLEPHMAKEERVLFPAITSHVPGATLTPPIACMQVEHEETGALLAAVRAAAGDYEVPADGCASYQALYARLADLEADTFRHIHLENNVLFPKVLAAT
jgi:regulator of cell morphogenesis and NO signaling